MTTQVDEDIKFKDSVRKLQKWKSIRRKKVIPISKYLEVKLTFDVEWYREAVFYRLIEQIEGVYLLYQKEMFVNSVCLARTSLETLAVLYDINRKLNQFLKDKNAATFIGTFRRLVFAAL